MVHAEYWEPLYRFTIPISDWEAELIRSRAFRRLKYIRHTGAAGLLSPLTHSRYEHTLGVWALVARWCPENRVLRAAALVHDLGHIPFSHSMEKLLGLDHHSRTEELIQSGEVAGILGKAGTRPAEVLDVLNGDTPLTNKTGWLGIDHLDSFLRDTFMNGRFRFHPSELVSRMSLSGSYIDCPDVESALAVMQTVYDDHALFTKPLHLAYDLLLAEAVRCHGDAVGSGWPEALYGMADHELLTVLERSPSTEASRLVRVLLYEPHRVAVSLEETPGARCTELRKIYAKQPLARGTPLSELSPQGAELLQGLDAFRRKVYVTVK